jgi:hypothetical protein
MNHPKTAIHHMRIILVLMSVIFLTACSGKGGKKNLQGNDSMPNTINPKISGNTDTLTIDKKTAVFYQPDSVAMQKWKNEVGEEDFETAADDWSYYMMTSHEYLDSMKVPIVETADKKFLKFVKTDKTMKLIKLDTLKNFWGVYLFIPAKDPKFADLLSIEDEYKSYYK